LVRYVLLCITINLTIDGLLYGFLFFSSKIRLCGVDVIGHVAEKDVIKETDKNGKKSKVMDITLEDLEYV